MGGDKVSVITDDFTGVEAVGEIDSFSNNQYKVYTDDGPAVYYKTDRYLICHNKMKPKEQGTMFLCDIKVKEDGEERTLDWSIQEDGSMRITFEVDSQKERGGITKEVETKTRTFVFPLEEGNQFLRVVYEVLVKIYSRSSETAE